MTDPPPPPPYWPPSPLRRHHDAMAPPPRPPYWPPQGLPFETMTPSPFPPPPWRIFAAAWAQGLCVSPPPFFYGMAHGPWERDTFAEDEGGCGVFPPRHAPASCSPMSGQRLGVKNQREREGRVAPGSDPMPPPRGQHRSTFAASGSDPVPPPRGQHRSTFAASGSDPVPPPRGQHQSRLEDEEAGQGAFVVSREEFMKEMEAMGPDYDPMEMHLGEKEWDEGEEWELTEEMKERFEETARRREKEKARERVAALRAVLRGRRRRDEDHDGDRG